MHHRGASAATRLTAIGEEHGVNPISGFAVDVLRDDFTVLSDNSRLWPQTERIKAHIAMAELADDELEWELAVDLARKSARRLRAFFGTDIPGLWHETLDTCGNPLPAPARASSLYHIVCCIREIERFINNCER